MHRTLTDRDAMERVYAIVFGSDAPDSAKLTALEAVVELWHVDAYDATEATYVVTATEPAELARVAS